MHGLSQTRVTVSWKWWKQDNAYIPSLVTLPSWSGYTQSVALGRANLAHFFLLCVCASPMVLRYRSITLPVCHFHSHSHPFLINSHRHWGCSSVHILWHVINSMIMKISMWIVYVLNSFMPRLVGNLDQTVQNHQTIRLVTRLCCTKVQEPICVGSQPFGSPKIDNDRRCQQSKISGSDTYCYKVYTDVYRIRHLLLQSVHGDLQTTGFQHPVSFA